jgi:hypothetical protein
MRGIVGATLWYDHLLTGTVNTGTVNAGTAGVSPAISAQREQSGNSKLLGDATQAGETPAVQY